MTKALPKSHFHLVKPSITQLLHEIAGFFNLRSRFVKSRKGYVVLATFGRAALILRTNRVIECDVKVRVRV